MTTFCLRISCLLCSMGLFFFLPTQAQSAKDFLVGGTWLGYITIEGKPVYKVTILSRERSDKSFVADIYFLRYTKKAEGVEYDTVKMYLNEHDTTVSFDLALPKESKTPCKGKVMVKRASLYNTRIKATYQPENACENVGLFLDETLFMLKDNVYSNPPDEGQAPAPVAPGSTASNTPAHTDSSKDGAAIDPKDITHFTDKSFKWYDWNKAPQALRAASKLIHTFKNRETQQYETLYDLIMKYLNVYQCTVQVAAADLDDNGIWGMAFQASGLNCCGSMGCTFGLFDDGGLKIAALITDRDPVPDRNRVKGAEGAYYSLKENNINVNSTQIQHQFSYHRNAAPAAVVNIAPKIPADLLGADTPDHLGRVMLKALQTNNKKLWASCIHPTYDFQRDPDRRDRVISEFDKIRSDLELKGISDWSKVTFSRIVAEPCDRCAAPGEKWLSGLLVEFWYQGKEFLGKISFTPVMTYKGKYYIGRNYDHDMIRFIAR